MKQFPVHFSGEIFPGSNTVLSFSFKQVGTRGQSAHFSNARKLLRNFSAELWKHSGEAAMSDCFGCLSLHEIAE